MQIVCDLRSHPSTHREQIFSRLRIRCNTTTEDSKLKLFNRFYTVVTYKVNINRVTQIARVNVYACFVTVVVRAPLAYYIIGGALINIFCSFVRIETNFWYL